MKKKVIRWKLKKLLLDSGKIDPDTVCEIVNLIAKKGEVIVPVEILANEIISHHERYLYAIKSGVWHV